MADFFKQNSADKEFKRLTGDVLSSEDVISNEELEKRRKKLLYVCQMNDADDALDRLQQKKSGRF